MSPTTTSDRDANRQQADAQAGFTLAGLIVILTIISIIVAYTVPSQWSLVMKRERDRQTIFLMRQYARAIFAFQQKHQTLPSSLEQLREARKPRAIRGGEEEWVCPVTGKPDWILVPQQAVTAPQGAPNPNAGTPNFVPESRWRNPTWNSTGNPRPASGPTGPGTGPGTGPALGPQPPMAGVPGAQQPGGASATQFPTSKLNPELSPPDYKGLFVSVRPRMTGKSIIAFNGAEDYGEWVFTFQDIQAEVAMRNQALLVK